MDISLVMVKSDGAKREFPLHKEKVVLGRANNCDLRIPLSSVSRRHAEIEMQNGAVKLRDLGSSNGTFHNSNRIEEAQLSAGDEILIGSVVFRVMIGGQPEGLLQDSQSSVDFDADDAAASEQEMAGQMTQHMMSDEDDLVAALREEADGSGVDMDGLDLDDDDPIAAMEALADSAAEDANADDEDEK